MSLLPFHLQRSSLPFLLMLNLSITSTHLLLTLATSPVIRSFQVHGCVRRSMAPVTKIFLVATSGLNSMQTITHLLQRSHHLNSLPASASQATFVTGLLIETIGTRLMPGFPRVHWCGFMTTSSIALLKFAMPTARFFNLISLLRLPQLSKRLLAVQSAFTFPITCAGLPPRMRTPSFL